MAPVEVVLTQGMLAMCASLSRPAELAAMARLRRIWVLGGKEREWEQEEAIDPQLCRNANAKCYTTNRTHPLVPQTMDACVCVSDVQSQVVIADMLASAHGAQRGAGTAVCNAITLGETTCSSGDLPQQMLVVPIDTAYTHIRSHQPP